MIPLEYLGHLRGKEGWLAMDQFAIPPGKAPYDVPTILIIGTSMDAGKTFAAQRVIRCLTAQGRRVAISGSKGQPPGRER